MCLSNAISTPMSINGSQRWPGRGGGGAKDKGSLLLCDVLGGLRGPSKRGADDIMAGDGEPLGMLRLPVRA